MFLSFAQNWYLTMRRLLAALLASMRKTYKHLSNEAYDSGRYAYQISAVWEEVGSGGLMDPKL